MAATLLMRSTISPYFSDCKLAHPDVVIEKRRMFWQFKHVIATVIIRIRIIVIARKPCRTSPSPSATDSGFKKKKRKRRNINE